MKNILNSRRLASLLALTVLFLGSTALAEENTSKVEGEVEVGAHVSDVTDDITRVSEYDLSRETVEPDLGLDLFGWSGTNRWDLFLKYHDEKTLDLKSRLEAGPYVNARFNHRSFVHWLDHDRLNNLEWREFVKLDTLGNDVPGGKMLTHDDTDPHDVYSIRYAETKGGVDVAVPGLKGTEIHVGFRDQVREGTRQVLSLDHCASCHVQSRTGEVDEETRDLTLGFSTEVSRLKFSYTFLARDFENRADGSENSYADARHPVTGGATDEFGSRTNYDGETLPIHVTPDIEKRGHTARATVDLPKSQSLRGAFSYSQVKNMNTRLELTANAASVGWFAPLTPKLRVAAGVSRRDVENDAILVDLAPWRADRPGGGQDFDFTRLSVYDREEYVGTASLAYALRPGHSLRLTDRIRSTDRDNLALDPDDPSETRTTQNRLRASWSGRLSPGMRSRASVEYEVTDLPFVNVNGICEDGIGDTVMPIINDDGEGQPNDWVYYFQRERIGTGGNLPTKALRLRANLSRRLGSRASGSLYVNYADEKNDDLNLYDFDRSVLSSGLSAYATPGEWGVLSGGVAYSRIESNAKFCATVMDG